MLFGRWQWKGFEDELVCGGGHTHTRRRWQSAKEACYGVGDHVYSNSLLI